MAKKKVALKKAKKAPVRKQKVSKKAIKKKASKKKIAKKKPTKLAQRKPQKKITTPAALVENLENLSSKKPEGEQSTKEENISSDVLPKGPEASTPAFPSDDLNRTDADMSEGDVTSSRKEEHPDDLND